MKIFTIENQTNNITAHATKRDAADVPNTESFNSAEKLAKLAANWPTARLVEIWNSLPGAVPVQNFNDRKKAIARIWKRIQSLGESISVAAAAETEPLTDETSESAAGLALVPESTQERPKPEVANQEIAATGSEEVHPEPAASEVEANVSAQSPDVAPNAEKVTKKTTRRKKTPTGETTPKAPRRKQNQPGNCDAEARGRDHP